MCGWVFDKRRAAWWRALGAVCVTERHRFQIGITLPSASRGSSSVSAPPVFGLTHTANRFHYHNTAPLCKRPVPSSCCPSTSRYVWEKSGAVIDVNTSPRLRQDPDGTLHISQTWSGDIGTYTCRVTSVGGNDSRNAHLRVRSVFPPSYLIVCISPAPLLLYLRLAGNMMDGCFLRSCGLSLLSFLIHQTL